IAFQLVEIGVGVLFLLVAQVLGRTHTKARVVMWAWAMGCVVIVAMLAAEAIRVNEQLPLAYGLIVMTAFPPVALAWRPSIAAGALMIVIVSVSVIVVDGTEDGRLIAAAVASLLVGAVLLRLRLKAIDALADEQARSAALVSTDVLTGVLSRHGLLTMMTGLAGTAERLGESICVMYFDVQHLATANEQYGSIYGDDVLRAVADAIKEHVRLGDLVARWGGDEFLVTGLGGKPNGEHLALRIQEAVRVSGVNLGKWPTTVRIGVAAGDPRETTFDQLVADAATALTPA
ncbi:MAG: GGDEF domain-containing protein, partial [bacterium]|nr:GGDEF domain-containing protein [bacterium]